MSLGRVGKKPFTFATRFGILNDMDTRMTSSTPIIDDALKQRIAELSDASGLSSLEILREAIEQFAAKRHAQKSGVDALYDAIAEIRASVPAEAWATLPTDLAKNFDHYHYGHPRED